MRKEGRRDIAEDIVKKVNGSFPTFEIDSPSEEL